MARERPVRIMRALAEAPDGLSTPAIVAALAEFDPTQRALTKYGQILRAHAGQGHVEKTGKTPSGGWQRPRSLIWRITSEGRAWLAGVDARNASLEQARAAQEAAHRHRTAALAEAASRYSRQTSRMERRVAAARLRELGCSLEEIGQIFGVSREMIRQDCLPFFEPNSEHPAGGLPQRVMKTAVLGDVMMVRVGKRVIYLTRTEAMRLTEDIGNWDSEQPSVVPA